MSDRFPNSIRGQAIRAKAIVPAANNIVTEGVVAVDPSGKMIDSNSGTVDDLGDVIVLPGFVNAHVHLEDSLHNEPLSSGRPFCDWVRALVGWRRANEDRLTEGVESGLRESADSGTTTLGEISRGMPELGESDPTAVLFHEVIGLLPEQIEPQLERARQHQQQTPGDSRIHLGLSPHAPYSVHPELYVRLIELAAEFQAPVAVHLAETPEELELLNSGSGQLVHMLTDFGVWRDDLFTGRRRPLDYLRPLVKLQHALVIHGNYLDNAEIDFLAQHPQITVVYCPRTHAFFGHSPHPWRQMLAKGVSLALGTDGRGSNPDLSLWGELCWLRRQFPEVDSDELLHLGTAAGAKALGMDEQTGTLEVGKWADLVLIDGSEINLADGDVVGQLMDQQATVLATYVQGQRIDNAVGKELA
ncbi:amidohydrolase family protein [Calycomorphotria hydatis]|nr:amidohydrolase family protein [Calycomorphotria hydatis]